ncbi:ROK family protein [Gryllotalpicola koreensis]|uniref:ROK family transcriptional regulator n=1 Tax=Gryllotalpicola koreensis TaxID=993086 RepID=A0ABP7ZP86_9MICO
MSLTRPERMNAAAVRVRNLGVVLSYLDDVGEAARTEIAAATGLVRGAVTLLTAELGDAGLVRPADAGARPRGAGRPLERLEVDGSDRAVLVTQLVVDELRILASDLAGRDLLRRAERVRLPHGDAAAVADLVAGTLTAEVDALAVRGIRTVATSIVVPAPVISAGGVVPVAVDLGWRDVDFRALVHERLPQRVPRPEIANDADCAAMAEFASLRSGPGALAIDDMVYLKSDTGIGGGAMIAGELLLGRDGMAFEPGHMVVVPAGERCQCGQRGCLVTVADPERVLATAGLAAYREQNGIPEAEAELLRRDGAGDERAARAVTELVGWLVHTVGVVDIMLRPQAFVLGGYLAPLAARVAAQRGDADGAQILAGVHGDFAGSDGASYSLRRALLRNPASLMTAG